MIRRETEERYALKRGECGKGEGGSKSTDREEKKIIEGILENSSTSLSESLVRARTVHYHLHADASTTDAL